MSVTNAKDNSLDDQSYFHTIVIPDEPFYATVDREILRAELVTGPDDSAQVVYSCGTGVSRKVPEALRCVLSDSFELPLNGEMPVEPKKGMRLLVYPVVTRDDRGMMLPETSYPQVTFEIVARKVAK